jgi:hypothetical protein
MNPYKEAVNLYVYGGSTIRRMSVLNQIVRLLRGLGTRKNTQECF